jgi:hypothetical protein
MRSRPCLSSAPAPMDADYFKINSGVELIANTRVAYDLRLSLIQKKRDDTVSVYYFCFISLFITSSIYPSW